ncbi:MAG: FHA domain-containing protein [Acidobacteria bacterium]|nr:FHA domain-containing protein [Acidobacteriota bacterium]
MANPKLITLDETEQYYELSHNISIGRASDNTICLTDETVSRYHAIIEERAGRFWVNDLGSVHGTTVNGIPIRSAYELQDGDVISIGGAVSWRFITDHQEVPENKTPDLAPDVLIGDEPPVSRTTIQGAPSPSPIGTPGDGQDDRLSIVHIGVAVAVGIIVFGIIGATLFWDKIREGRGDCGSARIVNPPSGAIISEAVTVRIRPDNPECIRSVSYKIDGHEFANSSPGSFETTLDPAKIRAILPYLSDGEHRLSIVVENESGVVKEIAESISLTLDLPDEDGEIGLDKIRSMVETLTTEITSLGGALEFEEEFLQRIRQATGEFRADVIPEAEAHRLEIRKAFNDAGINYILGFILAGSRSRFKDDQAMSGCGVDPNSVGILKVPHTVIAQYSQSNSKDSTAAVEVGARHLKGLMDSFGETEDFIYAVACFGKPAARAGGITQLTSPHERRNFWKLVKKNLITSDEANRVVCFFAAGIVAENPDKFGLNTKSLREVYR